MKYSVLLGAVLILFGKVTAQIIPNNFVVKVSYDTEITTFKQISASADINQLTDLEKLSFKPVTERQHQEHYLGYDNNTTTVIDYGQTSSGEEVYGSQLARLIINANGVFGYTPDGRPLDLGPTSQEAQESTNALREMISPQNFFVWPQFVQLSPEAVGNAQSRGYVVTKGDAAFTLAGNGEEYTHDGEKKFTERKVYQDGHPLFTTRQFYATDDRGQNIPTIKIETSYETSLAGLLIEVVRVEKITTYSKIIN